MRTRIKKYTAEFIGTFAMIFFGCGASMVASKFPTELQHLGISITFGLVVASMIYAVGHISGAHFNPAVTLGFTVGKHFPKKDLLGYVLAQFSGAIAAMSLLAFCLPETNQFGVTIPIVMSLQALTLEIIFTFFLMFVIVSVATDTRAVGIMAGAAIGSTVTLIAYMGGPLTGASMNPARSLAPALFQGNLNSLWIYFVGPCIGSTLAVLVYNWLRHTQKSHHDNETRSQSS